MEYILKTIKEKRLLTLLAVATIIRAYVWIMTPVIGRDGLEFVKIAKLFSEGNFFKGLEHPYHPLYSLLISFCSLSGLDYEDSGRLISLIFGLLAILVVYIIGKEFFNPTIAFISALIFTIHPYTTRLSVDVMSDSIYYFFYLAGFGLGFIAIKTNKVSLFFYTGVASAFAYLIRPEGVSPILITGLFVTLLLIKNLVLRLKEKFQHKNNLECEVANNQQPFKAITLLVIGFIIFSLPYVIYIKHETGLWTLTKKKDVSEISGLTLVLENTNKQNIQSQPEEDKNNNIYIEALYKIVTQYCDALHYPMLLFLLIGIIKIYKTDNRLSNLYICSYIILFFVILFFLRVYSGYASYRHLMNIALVTIFWVAIGINQFYEWITKKIPAISPNNFAVREIKVKCKPMIINSLSGFIFLCVLSGLFLPKTLKPHREEKIVRKEAGVWLLHYDNSTPIVLTDKLVTAFYAKAKGIDLPNNLLDYESIVDYTRTINADYLIISERFIKQCPSFLMDVKPNDFEKLNEFIDKKKKIIIYKVVDYAANGDKTDF